MSILSRYHVIKFCFALLGLSLALLMTRTTNATILKDEKELGFASERDLTDQGFSASYKKYANDGYMMIDVDGYTVDGSLLYSMVWRKNTDNRVWAEHRELKLAELKSEWDEFKSRGFRPLDIAAYPFEGQIRFAVIWVENKENIKAIPHFDLTDNEFTKIYKNMRNSDFQLVDMEAYQTSGGLLFTAIWYKNTNNVDWDYSHVLKREEYDVEVENRLRQGYKAVDFEHYKINSEDRYAIIWEKKPDYAYAIRTDRTEIQFANWWREYRDKGFRLVDFERYATSDGSRYGGIWVENRSRYRYPKKDDLDKIIEIYKEANNLPGISVAIIQNGNTIYRRGFGYADIGSGKKAHSETVYNAASVSKAISGTLAAKLEDEDVLSDGTSITWDMTQPTRNYINNLPAHHNAHNVEDLFAHLSCVAHYDCETEPSIPNTTDPFPNHIAAATSIWGTGLVNRINLPGECNPGGPCGVGSTQSYSTPGFTIAGAALESATGRNANQLLQDELFDRYNLDSMRVQFVNQNIQPDYERATHYDTSNNPLQGYENNSWKVFGGGIETSGYDLARFGWKVLNGDIVQATARDNRMWTQVDPASTYGIGWRLNRRNGKAVAEHDGSWRGARSFLCLYRNDGLVIAVMSNRNEHEVDDVTGLTECLASIIFGGGLQCPCDTGRSDCDGDIGCEFSGSTCP